MFTDESSQSFNGLSINQKNKVRYAPRIFWFGILTRDSLFKADRIRGTVRYVKEVLIYIKDTSAPPVTEMDWFEERGRLRGVDFTAYK